MNRAPMFLLPLGALASSCGSKPMLGRDTFVQAAKDCGAHRATFSTSAAKDEAPSIQVLDTDAVVDGRRISVPRCIAAKIAPYNYTQIELQAPPLRSGS